MRLRAHQRLPATYSAILVVGDARFAVRFVDVSNSGAKLAGNIILQDQIFGALHFGNSIVAIQVRWFQAGRCGVKFDRLLSAEEMAVIRHLRTVKKVAGKVQAPRPRFTELR